MRLNIAIEKDTLRRSFKEVLKNRFGDRRILIFLAGVKPNFELVIFISDGRNNRRINNFNHIHANHAPFKNRGERDGTINNAVSRRKKSRNAARNLRCVQTDDVGTHKAVVKHRAAKSGRDSSLA